MATTLPENEALELPEGADYQEPVDHPEYEEYEEEESLSTPWPMLCFLAVPALELLGQTISDEESQRALLVFPAVVVLTLVAIVDMFTRSRSRDVRFDSSLRRFFWFTGWLVLLGVFSAVYAWLKGNAPLYIAADIYHWFIEIIATAFLGVWAASRYSLARVCSSYVRACVVYGLIGVAVTTLGMLHMAPGGGSNVQGSSLFRLELGRGYPLIPLIIVGSIFFYPTDRMSSRTKAAVLLASILLGLAMLATLKRTQWLVVPVCLFGAMLTRRQLIFTVVMLACGFVVLWAANNTMPHQVENFVELAKEKLTYNKNWTIDQTMKARELQAQDGIREGLRSPVGQGFGAEIDTISALGTQTVKVHYLHSLHAYYILHFGPLGYGVVLFSVGALCLAVFRAFDQVVDCQWMVRAALFSLLAFVVTGLTMVSVHTCFAGVALALGITSYSRYRDEITLAALHEWEEEQQAREAFEREMDSLPPRPSADNPA
jgi:hypothetical protein